MSNRIDSLVYRKLPPFLQELTDAVEPETSKDIVLVSAITTLSGLYGNNVEGEYHGRMHSPHLNSLILGSSGAGKSAAQYGFALARGTDEYVIRQSELEQADWRLNRDETKRQNQSNQENQENQGPSSPETALEAPPPRCLVTATNITDAALLRDLKANPAGLLMLDTEIDGLTAANNRDFGNFTYAVRQAYHHEAIRVSRKGEGHTFIKRPRLGICLTGTPQQFYDLMSRGAEDGFYSRFCIYRHEAPFKWIDPRPRIEFDQINNLVNRWSVEHVRVWKALAVRSNSLRIELSPLAWDVLSARIQDLCEKVSHFNNGSLLPIAKRAGLNAFRIAMTLCLVRKGSLLLDELATADRLKVIDEDVYAAVSLARTLALHSMRESAGVDDNIGGAAEELTREQVRFYCHLSPEFRTQEAVEAITVTGLTVSETTVKNWLKSWSNGREILEKVSHGRYRKLKSISANGSGADSLDFLDSLDC